MTDHVLYIDDLVPLLRISRRTIVRLRRAGVFPIPEVRGLGSRPKWLRVEVERFLASPQASSSGVVGRRRAS